MFTKRTIIFSLQLMFLISEVISTVELLQNVALLLVE